MIIDYHTCLGICNPDKKGDNFLFNFLDIISRKGNGVVVSAQLN